MVKIVMKVDGLIWQVFVKGGTNVAQQIQSQFGKINIREEVIAKISGVAAMECYGLVGNGPAQCSRRIN